MRKIKIVSEKSAEDFNKCSLCGIELTQKTIYFDEDYSYCKECLKEVLSTSLAEEIKINRYGQI